MTVLLMRTPPPYADESPRNYVIRLTEENGYTDPTIIQSLVGRKLGYVVTVGWDYRELQTVLGSKVTLPPNFGYRSENKKTREGVRFGGHLIHPRHLGMMKARICPDCIKDLGYIPRAHDLKAFIACPVHGRLMLKNCPECGWRIRYDRPGLLVCKCGADLSLAKMEPAAPALVGLMEILWEKVHGPSIGHLQASALGFPTQNLLAMDLEVLCRAIVTLSITYIQHAKSKSAVRSLSEVIDVLPQVAKLFAQWPLNFKDFCGRYHRATVERSPALQVFQRTFSWLFVRLYKNLKRKNSQTVFLVEAALQYGVRKWDRRPIFIKDKQLRELELPPKRFGTYSDAAKLLSWQPATSHRWIQNGRLPARMLPTKGKKMFWQCDLDRIAEMKFSAHPLVGVRDAAREIELPHAVYRTLAKGGHIAKGWIVEQRASTSIEDLRAYRNELLERGNIPIPKSACHKVGEFLDSQLPIPLKAYFVEEIRCGNIEVFGKCETIRELRLVRDLVAEHRRSRIVSSTSIGLYEAAKQYDLSFYEVRGIFVHLSGRRPSAKNGSKQIVTAKLEAFLREFVPMRSVAAEMGVFGITLRQAVEKTHPSALLRITAACGPQSKGGEVRPYFVKKGHMKEVRRIAMRLARKPDQVMQKRNGRPKGKGSDGFKKNKGRQ